MTSQIEKTFMKHHCEQSHGFGGDCRGYESTKTMTDGSKLIVTHFDDDMTEVTHDETNMRFRYHGGEYVEIATQHEPFQALDVINVWRYESSTSRVTCDDDLVSEIVEWLVEWFESDDSERG